MNNNNDEETFEQYLMLFLGEALDEKTKNACRKVWIHQQRKIIDLKIKIRELKKENNEH